MRNKELRASTILMLFMAVLAITVTGCGGGGGGGGGGTTPPEVAPVVYLDMNDGTHGYELGVTDGTEVGTYLVKDIRTGVGQSNPSVDSDTKFAFLDSNAYFVAYDDTHGQELWKSDGTSAGTTIVKDIYAGTNGSNPNYLDPVRKNGEMILVSHFLAKLVFLLFDSRTWFCQQQVKSVDLP